MKFDWKAHAWSPAKTKSTHYGPRGARTVKSEPKSDTTNANAVPMIYDVELDKLVPMT